MPIHEGICLAAKAMRQFLARYTLKIRPHRRGGCLKRWLTLALDSIEYLSDMRDANAFNWNVRPAPPLQTFPVKELKIFPE